MLNISKRQSLIIGVFLMFCAVVILAWFMNKQRSVGVQKSISSLETMGIAIEDHALTLRVLQDSFAQDAYPLASAVQNVQWREDRKMLGWMETISSDDGDRSVLRVTYLDNLPLELPRTVVATSREIIFYDISPSGRDLLWVENESSFILFLTSFETMHTVRLADEVVSAAWSFGEHALAYSDDHDTKYIALRNDNTIAQETTIPLYHTATTLGFLDAHHIMFMNHNDFTIVDLQNLDHSLQEKALTTENASCAHASSIVASPRGSFVLTGTRLLEKPAPLCLLIAQSESLTFIRKDAVILGWLSETEVLLIIPNEKRTQFSITKWNVEQSQFQTITTNTFPFIPLVL